MSRLAIVCSSPPNTGHMNALLVLTAAAFNDLERELEFAEGGQKLDIEGSAEEIDMIRLGLMGYWPTQSPLSERCLGSLPGGLKSWGKWITDFKLITASVDIA